jgi:predicted RNA-binding Zn-ribbon protein involved in translation (DUF1610 family)
MSAHAHPAGRAREGPALEVAELLREHLDAVLRAPLSSEQHAAVRALLRCRTAQLGGHLDTCVACGFARPSYNSCRDRHCPKCQGLAQARWVRARMQRVLGTHHFHAVFTLPAELRSLALRNRSVVFELLMKAAADSLLELGRDPKWLGAPAQLGITAVLHTWTRELAFHPHVHCIVTGGGLALDGSRWVSAPGEFLFPVRVLAALFRGKVLDGLARARRDGKLRLAPEDEGRVAARRTDALHRASWIVYAKRPFGGPEQVYRYLGRYTHRVAISNSRLVSATNETVTFRTRGDQMASLPTLVFLKRFLQHVLPFGFVKIRHYGLLASGNVTTRLERARALLGGGVAERDEQIKQQDSESDESWPEMLAAVAAGDVTLCPSCGAQALQRGPLPSPHPRGARAPPQVAA